ncbi:MAG: hypothetical protein KGL39_10190 [Patescibacteria group bacterium]|nr:hypothetical protein [Patescibacteria group bacterium]
MAWPPAYSTAFLGTGTTTIRWGTDGIMANTSPNGSGGGVGGYYTVESIRANDELDTMYIEQGTGLRATRIQLIQGRRYVLTVVDDTNMTPPGASTYISLVDITGGGASIYQCRIIENGYNAARKVEGKRELTVEYLTLIEGGGTIPEN